MQLTLDSDIFKVPDIKKFIGKEVLITIIELPVIPLTNKKSWRYLGAANLKNKLNKINIRDLAYD